MKCFRGLLISALLCLPWASLHAQSTAAIGVVVMHGKGGNPDGLTAPLADGLKQRGFWVANLEMPWSRRRSYDVDVATADKEVAAAITAMRKQGAKKIFMAGHSQGAVYALHFAGSHPLDGLVIIAPGGNVATAFYQGKVGASITQAREMIAQGKEGEDGEFDEFEGSKGRWTVKTRPMTYLSWFVANGAMNQLKSSAALPKSLPVLHVAPTSDYPALMRAKQEMFDALPEHPLKRLYEPNSDHRNAPRDSVDEIAKWIAEVAAK